MTAPNDVVVLLDGDNTLLDNDLVQVDLGAHLEREFGSESRDRYRAILEPLRAEVGYVDDKLRILAAMKRAWEERLTTIFARQGHYALDPKNIAAFPAADVTVEGIGDLVNRDLPARPGATGAGRLEQEQR